MTNKNLRGMNYDELVRITIEASAKALKDAGCEVSVPTVVFHAAEILFREVQDPHIYAERETELIPIVKEFLGVQEWPSRRRF